MLQIFILQPSKGRNYQVVKTTAHYWKFLCVCVHLYFKGTRLHKIFLFTLEPHDKPSEIFNSGLKFTEIFDLHSTYYRYIYRFALHILNNEKMDLKATRNNGYFSLVKSNKNHFAFFYFTQIELWSRFSQPTWISIQNEFWVMTRGPSGYIWGKTSSKNLMQVYLKEQ